jgi:hypothetical protein
VIERVVLGHSRKIITHHGEGITLEWGHSRMALAFPFGMGVLFLEKPQAVPRN